MNRIGIIFFVILILSSCANDSNNQKEKTTPQNQDVNTASILGTWKLSASNPILEGNYVSEYFQDNTFRQNGTITSFQPNYTCKASSNGTFSISNNILSYSYLAEKMYDCQPEEYQLMVNSYMGSKSLETSQNKIILLTEKTMIQENLDTKEQFTFTRIEE